MSIFAFGNALVVAAASIDTFEGRLDKLINDTAPRTFSVLKEMTRKLAEHEITLAQFEEQYTRLQALNAQGSGFLGDLDALLLKIRSEINGLGVESAGAAGSTGGAAGEQTSSGFGSGSTPGGGDGPSWGRTGQPGATVTTEAAPSSIQGFARGIRRR